MSKDYLLNSNYDIEFINGELLLTDQEQSLLQRIKQRLLIFRGEWFLDQSLGINYFDDILIKSYDLSRIEAIFIKELQSIDGIAEILSLELSVNKTERKLDIISQIRTDINDEIITIEI